jgi:hypothetical protein
MERLVEAAKRTMLAAMAAALLAAPAVAQEDPGVDLPDEGWWVVVRTVPDDPAAWDDTTAFADKVRACGIDAFGDFSAKFTNFRPGFVATVHMVPFTDKSEALAMLERAKRCVPDAYVKYGRYAGE